MFLLLVCKGIFLFPNILIISTIASEDLAGKVKNAYDGEQYVKEIIDGKRK